MRNNRVSVYVSRSYPLPSTRHCEIKNGKKVWVDGLPPNPYKGVSTDSLTLQARIDSGTFENHEGSPHHLEKVNGADVMTAEIERQQEAYQEAKEKARVKSYRKKFNDALKKHNPELKDVIKDDDN